MSCLSHSRGYLLCISGGKKCVGKPTLDCKSFCCLRGFFYVFSHSLSAGRIACQRSLYPLSVAKWVGYKQVFQYPSAGVAQLDAATLVPTVQRPFLQPVRLFADRAAALSVRADAVPLVLGRQDVGEVLLKSC